MDKAKLSAMLETLEMLTGALQTCDPRYAEHAGEIMELALAGVRAEVEAAAL